jgi:hypothetical protein
MKLKYILLILLILILGAAGAYWYYFIYGTTPAADNTPAPVTSGFVPFDRNTSSNIPYTTSSATPEPTPGTDGAPVEKPPRLRLLSNTPVGGYVASTTLPNKTLATPGVTLVRWVDRGRGNTYQAQSDTVSVETLSNTVVPHIVDSLWNTNATSFIASMLLSDNSGVDLVYTQLRPQTGTSTAPYSLRGTGIHTNVLAYAISPRKDRVFALVLEGGTSVGYVSSLDGQKMTKIFTTPLTQVTVEWPEENTLAITTKAAASQQGFLYFVHPTTGVWRKILGPTLGLTTKVSHDALYVIASGVTSNPSNLRTSIYNVKTGTTVDAVIRTIADKCAWGNFYKEIVYCGVPRDLPNLTYPDSWYIGTYSFSDKIWQINANTSAIR